MTIKPANGVTGHLLRTGYDVVFRVYGENHQFTDYDLTHSDLCVTITDEDAAFYSRWRHPREREARVGDPGKYWIRRGDDAHALLKKAS